MEKTYKIISWKNDFEDANCYDFNLTFDSAKKLLVKIIFNEIQKEYEFTFNDDSILFCQYYNLFVLNKDFHDSEIGKAIRSFMKEKDFLEFNYKNLNYKIVEEVESKDLKKSGFIFDNKNDWIDVVRSVSGKEIIYQHKKCELLFKSNLNKKPFYLEAILFQDSYNLSYFGDVYIDDKEFKRISSRQYVTFPFVPKTFKLDVVYVDITKEEAEKRHIIYQEDFIGGYYYTKLKNPKQSNKVFKYYNGNYE